MSTDAVERPLTPNILARLAQATRYAITGVSPDGWFGPQQPLAPMAPPEVKGRLFDYAFGANLNYVPRSEGGVSFAELRALADALPLLRAIIETRKDQIAAQNFTVRQRARADRPDASPRIDAALRFLSRPDRRRSFADWLRILIEDLLVIDAATIYPRYTRSGALYSLDVIDGATIKPLIGEDGRAPQAPDPAYQQILDGLPAADFSADELLYLPRNARAHKLYGMSPVEARDQAQLEIFGARVGSTIQAHEICDEFVVGPLVAQTILQRELYVRAKFTFKLSWEYCLLNPMDIVTITDSNLGLSNYPVRIITIEEDDTVINITAGSGTPLYYFEDGAGNHFPAAGIYGVGGDYQADVTLSHALKVDASATTQPVSGTFWQATQPVSGTFWQATQPVSIASMPSTPVTGTFWQTTQPVSLSSLPSLAAGSNLVGSVTDTASGAATNPTSTLTLTSSTSAYTAGQFIANNATAGSVTVPSFAIANSAGGALISRLRLTTNDATSTAWGGQTITVDLWSAAPTFTNGDRGAWSPATGTANHLGAFSCAMSAEYGDGAYGECAPAVG
jgi:hypothetical protein